MCGCAAFPPLPTWPAVDSLAACAKHVRCWAACVNAGMADVASVEAGKLCWRAGSRGQVSRCVLVLPSCSRCAVRSAWHNLFKLLGLLHAFRPRSNNSAAACTVLCRPAAGPSRAPGCGSRAGGNNTCASGFGGAICRAACAQPAAGSGGRQRERSWQPLKQRTVGAAFAAACAGCSQSRGCRSSSR